MPRLFKSLALAGFVSGSLLALALVSIWVVLAQVPLPPPQLPQATEVLDRDGQLITRLFSQNRTEVPLGSIPEHLRAAFIATEDTRFYQHRGIDPRALARALWRNLRARAVVEGGSTLTQQLAKNLYLTHERTLTRKLKEAFYTLKLEAMYSKDELLNMYLNTIYLGEGAYGVQAASQTYFGKDVSDLSLAEAALVAGLARGPEIYNPFLNLQAATDRRSVVLDHMLDGGFLARDQADRARRAPVDLATRHRSSGAPYFSEYVTRLIQANLPLVAANLRQGGYRIETTLDLGMQKAAEAALAEGLPASTPDRKEIPQPQAALVAIDPESGQIRALVGGRDYRSTPYNRAVDAPRQPGSAFKPFIYATLLESRQYTPASTQICEPVSYPVGPGQPPYRPKDFEPEHPFHNRPLAMREALAVSDNVVAVRWMNTIGPQAVIDTARNLGIRSPLRSNLSLALGSSEVTVLEMATAFAPFANGGMAVEPLAISRILDDSGSVVAEFTPARRRVLDSRTAYMVTDLLRDVLRPGGTAGQVAGMIGGRPAAGKTGTTDNSRDGWIVAYTPDVLAAVWVGNDDNQQPLPSGHTGATLSAPIWARFAQNALRDVPPRDFRRPEGLVDVSICTATGQRADGKCPSRREIFLAGTEPAPLPQREPSWLEQWLKQLPNVGTPTTPGSPAPRFRVPPALQELLEWPWQVAPLPFEPEPALPEAGTDDGNVSYPGRASTTWV